MFQKFFYLFFVQFLFQLFKQLVVTQYHFMQQCCPWSRLWVQHWFLNRFKIVLRFQWFSFYMLELLLKLGHLLEHLYHCSFWRQYELCCFTIFQWIFSSGLSLLSSILMINMFRHTFHGYLHCSSVIKLHLDWSLWKIQ